MREQRLVFGEVADVYDEVRVGYPDALVDEVFGYLGGVPEEIVEVGAGTGKGTAAFAGRGARLTCVEPDPAMAAVLRTRFPDGRAVRVVVARFEEWVPPPGGVPLVVCANAWHWVPEGVRLERAAAALRPGGTLALFGHQYSFADQELDRAVHDVAGGPYARWAPELLDAGGPPPPPAPQDHWLAAELSGCPLFTGARAVAFESVLAYPTDRYLRLLSTFSPHRLLPGPRRERLHAAIAEVIDAHGGVARQRVTTVLALGRAPSGGG